MNLKGEFIANEKVLSGPLKMALDETLAKKANELNKVTLRFYSFSKPSIVIGYFQDPKEEIYLEKAKKDNVEIIKRMTGGGAVYKDPKEEINYSITLPEHLTHKDILKSHEHLNSAIVNALKKNGLNATHHGINDILVDGKKISGNAQTRLNKGVLHHGTLLFDFDFKSMKKYLKISPEKIKDPNRKEVGQLKIEKEKLMQDIKTEFEKLLNNVNLIVSNYDEKDIQDSLKILQKYKDSKWTGL